MKWSFVMCFIFFSCSTYRVRFPDRINTTGASVIYKAAFPFTWQQRDSMVLAEFNNGNVPPFLQRFLPVETTLVDSNTASTIKAVYFVAADYFSIGTKEDWARVNITPYAAQKIADRLHCFLPTRKMVNDIYRSAAVKLEPVPMYAFRDSTPTMYQHHLIIEGQRKGRKGLIGGIKKDVVISGKLIHENRPGRVAIYGWNQLNGKPIQPLYTGHVFWWVDYSQGIRLVYEQVKVNGKWMNYRDILKDPLLKNLLCDEEYCDCYRYPVE